MVVGTTYIDYNKVSSFVGHPNQFVDWVDSLVPKWAQHIAGLKDNQRYYMAIHVRKVISIPYVQRMQLIEPLIDGIHVCGSVDGFISITDILSDCNKELLIAAIKDGVDNV